MAIEKISRGVTFKGISSTMGLILFVVNIFVVIFAAFVEFSPVMLLIGLALMTIGMVMFLSIRGVFIDAEQKRIMPYLYFFGRFGTWESLANYDKIKLSYLNESRTMNSRAGSVTHTTRCFDIFLASENKRDLLLKDFTDYEEAKTFLSKYAMKLGKAEVNLHEQMKEQLQKRRQQVRR